MLIYIYIYICNKDALENKSNYRKVLAVPRVLFAVIAVPTRVGQLRQVTQLVS